MPILTSQGHDRDWDLYGWSLPYNNYSFASSLLTEFKRAAFCPRTPSWESLYEEKFRSMWNLMHYEWCWSGTTSHASITVPTLWLQASLTHRAVLFPTSCTPNFWQDHEPQPSCMWSHQWREVSSPALLEMFCLWRRLVKPLLAKPSSSMGEVSWREDKSDIAQGRPKTSCFWDHTAETASKKPSDQHSKWHLQWKMNLIFKNLFCHYKGTKMLPQRQG